MLATLRNLFLPQHVAATMKTMDPLATTIMDRFFKDRPTHHSPLIGKADLHTIAKTIPVVRRDGTPISLDTEEMSMEFVAPLPVKPKVNVSASELNDLKALLGNTMALEAWRRNKVDQIRRAIRDTTEGICSVVLTTGKISWPVQLEGGRTENYEIDYGPILNHVVDAPLTADTPLSEVYDLLTGMEQKIRMAGVGGSVTFLAGKNVAKVFIDMANGVRTTVESKPISIKLDKGKVTIAGYEIEFMSETYPAPISGQWVSKLDENTLLAVTSDSQGKIWYCAIDSVSANNAAVPLHIVPVTKDDDSGITLIGQSKPMPARHSKASCRCVVLF